MFGVTDGAIDAKYVSSKHVAPPFIVLVMAL